MTSRRFLIVLCLAGLGIVLCGPVNARDVSEGQRLGHLSIDLQNPQIASLRLEIFDASTGGALWDSGLRTGAALVVSHGELADWRGSSLRYELRAWDGAGDLLLSQVSSLAARGLGEISSIGFDSLPAGSRGVAPAIELQGDVEVTGSLSASELRSSGGGAFFGSCPSGQSIRLIQPDGAVTCEAGGGAAGDNLGNHQASQTLVMGNDWIDFVPGYGVRSTQGAEIKTGPMGRTFLIQAGTAPDPRDSSIAHFIDQNDGLALAVRQSGVLDFVKGQKLCSVYGVNGRHNILASAGWTASTCNAYRNAVSASNYQLFCIFADTFTFGTANGGIPTTNCGW